MPAIDPVNSRIYAMDPGPGKVVGIDFDQETGKMTLAWSVDQKTLSWFVLIGPAYNRVIVGTNISSNITDPAALEVGPKGVNYVEQIQWREAATCKLLAASDFFSPMSVGFQVLAWIWWTHIRGIKRRPLNGIEGITQITNSTSPSTPTMSTTAGG
jgi:hypothetical protein